MIDYDPHGWRSHLLDIKGSMVRQIFSRVLACVVWSGLVVAIHKGGIPLAISDRGHMLIGAALGLLLVFRTNASYDRFWEARKQWGSIINETRNLARSASVYLAAAPDLMQQAIRWTIAFPRAVLTSLRGDMPALGPVADRLPEAEVRQTLAADHVPLAVARQISLQLAEARRRGVISDYVQVTIDQNVQLLMDYMGACERIHRTPLPFAYVVHLRRAIILYCFSLPFALIESFGWMTIVATLLLSYALYGIEEIGVEIEDPFGTDDNDLPLERFCATIERNLEAIVTQAASGAAAAPATPGSDPQGRDGENFTTRSARAAVSDRVPEGAG